MKICQLGRAEALSNSEGESFGCFFEAFPMDYTLRFFSEVIVTPHFISIQIDLGLVKGDIGYDAHLIILFAYLIKIVIIGLIDIC